MKRIKGLQQKGERRVAAALRILLVVVLLALQIATVLLLTRYLKNHFAAVYGALELLALLTAMHVYNKPGDLSYKVAWVIPILFVPVVGLILYLLWGGDTQRKRLNRRAAGRGAAGGAGERARAQRAERGPPAACAARLGAHVAVPPKPRLPALPEHRNDLFSGGRAAA